MENEQSKTALLWILMGFLLVGEGRSENFHDLEDATPAGRRARHERETTVEGGADFQPISTKFDDLKKRVHPTDVYYFRTLQDRDARKSEKALTLGSMDSHPALEIADPILGIKAHLVRLKTSAKSASQARKLCEDFPPRGEWKLPPEKFMKSLLLNFHSVSMDTQLVPRLIFLSDSARFCDQECAVSSNRNSEVGNPIWTEKGKDVESATYFEIRYPEEEELRFILSEDMSPASLLDKIDEVGAMLASGAETKRKNINSRIEDLKETLERNKGYYFYQTEKKQAYLDAKRELDEALAAKTALSFENPEQQRERIQNGADFMKLRQRALDGIPVLCLRRSVESK